MLSVTMAGLNAAQKAMDVTSNNMANSNTVGFKRSFANFGDVFSNDPAANPKTSVGSGVLTSSVSRDTSAGALKTTGRVTDLSIDGRGYFIVRDPQASGDSFSFSRAGNFGLDSLGFVVDPGGNQLIGYDSVDSGRIDANGSPIMVPNASAAKVAVRILPQYNNGEILPDGSIVGQEKQALSFTGPAEANGKILVQGIPVAISAGDSIATIASKVKQALSTDATFSSLGRKAEVIGSGDTSKVLVTFGAKEGDVSALTVTDPTFVIGDEQLSGSLTQKITVSGLASDGTFAANTTVTISNPTLGDVQVEVAQGDKLSDLVTKATAALPAGSDQLISSIQVDPQDPNAVLVNFKSTASPQPLITVTSSDPTVTVASSNFGTAIEEFSFSAPGVDSVINIAGLTIPVTSNDTAASIANNVQTKLASVYKLRTFTQVTSGSNVILRMSLGPTEINNPKLRPTLVANKPTATTVTETVKGSLDPVLMQGLSISSKGEVAATYSNGSTYSLAFLALANFPNEGGLKSIGSNRFVQTGISGNPSISPAGAPKAGNIMSGTLEQSNVDITNELMEMIRSQQVYNGNARVLQTTIETVSKITDMR